MKRRITALFLLGAMLLSVLTGCGGSTGGDGENETTAMKTITDLNGETIQVPEKINKIAAVYGPSYESMVVLGAEDKIVVCADVQVEDFPWAKKVFGKISSLPYLENVHTAVNIEELLKYNPDVVFGFPRPNEEKKLEEAKVTSIPGTTTKTLADIPALLNEYADALGGDAVDKAKKYEEYFNEKLNYVKQITDTIPESDRPTVYFAGSDILTTYGKSCDIPELIETAGGTASTKDLAGGNRVSVNFEQFASYNPDYIFIDHGGINDRNTVEDIMNNTYSDGRYASVSAVVNKQIYLVPSGVFYWDMGLQKILLLMYMAKILHPEEFKDMNIINEVKEFYSTFFDYKLSDGDAQKILNRENP